MPVFKLYTAKYRDKLPLGRTCSRCRQQFVHVRNIEVRDDQWHSPETPRGEVQLKVGRLLTYYQSPYADATYGAYCPHCDNFTPAAIATHFPNGLREGILAKLNLALRGDGYSLFMHNFFVPFTLWFVWFFWQVLQGAGKEQGERPTAWVLLGAPLLVFVLWKLASFGARIFIVSRAREILGELSESQVRQWLLGEYLLSAENLELPNLFPPSFFKTGYYSQLYGYSRPVGHAPGQHARDPRAHFVESVTWNFFRSLAPLKR